MPDPQETESGNLIIRMKEGRMVREAASAASAQAKT